MTSKNCTSSMIAVITAIALSAPGITTTFNTSGMSYNDPSWAFMHNLSENDMGTTTPSPKTTKTGIQTNYNFGKELFENDMRDFTSEEAEIYKASLKKIYKSTGVNIFDIC